MYLKNSSPVGESALKKQTGAVIGLSIRNSYFRKKENLLELLTWATKNFKQVYVMCPDVPSIDTLRSLGYTESEAKSKATLACNNLVNKCNKILNELGAKASTQIVRWNAFENSPAYQYMYDRLKKLYAANSEFQNDVRSATKSVIENHGTAVAINEAIDLGVEFFLKELAFIINAAEILELPLSAYIYHKDMPVFQKLLDGHYGFTSPANSGYLIYETNYSRRQEK